MNVVIQAAVGAVMLAISIATISFMIIIGKKLLEAIAIRIAGTFSLANQVATLTFMAFWLSLGMFVVMLLWAILLCLFGLFDDLYTSLYFTMIAFTTLGFGDITLPIKWGMFSGFIATGGFILFGLETAFLFEVLRRIGDEKVQDAG